jgi:hypothetical protein
MLRAVPVGFILKVVKALSSLLLVCAMAFSASAQTVKYEPKNPPRFQDFPVTETWKQPPAPLKLTTGSERMFRTQLINAGKEAPNFAGHYRITYWGCGSVCSAGALIDLQTGDAFPLPLANPNGTGWDKWIMCAASFEGTDDEFKVNSRLMIVRCGMNCSEQLQNNIPNTLYFLWERDRFRQLLFISGKQPRR